MTQYLRNRLRKFWHFRKFKSKPSQITVVSFLATADRLHFISRMEGFCRFVCVFFVPFVLQGVGFLAPNWISNTHCSKLGLFYRCCGTEECIIDNADTCKFFLIMQKTLVIIIKYLRYLWYKEHNVTLLNNLLDILS